jgi:hypothetical protein
MGKVYGDLKWTSGSFGESISVRAQGIGNAEQNIELFD